MDIKERRSQTLYVVTTSKNIEEILKESLPEVNVVFLSTVGTLYEGTIPAFDEDDALLKKVEVLYTGPRLLNKYMDRLVNLKWVHCTANGIDRLFKRTDAPKEPPKFVITRTHGSANAPNTTEYVIGQIIARERNFLSIPEAQAAKDWKTLRERNTCRNLSDITIGVMGLGGIGQHLAQRCKAMDMTVWVLTKHRRPTEDRLSFVDEYRTTEELGEFLQNCDYICNVLPSTHETRNLLSNDVLQHCSTKKAVFINVARGDIIDEKSLITALENNWLGGAILDVFEKEPLPQDSPLWTLPGVTITPHVSGWSHTSTHRRRIVDCFISNYNRYIRGEPFQHTVDWEKGY